MRQLKTNSRRHFVAQRWLPTRAVHLRARKCCFTCRAFGPAPAAASLQQAASSELDVGQLYTSQAYQHTRFSGPAQLEAIPGKGLGWRAARDLATGELLLVSLPLVVLYGSPGEPPGNDELAAALRQAWTRLVPLERGWLRLLRDCCLASAPPSPQSAVMQSSPSSSQPLAAAEADTAGEARSAAGGGGAAAPPSLGALLDRARALLAEAQSQVGTQIQEDVTGAEAPEPVARASEASDMDTDSSSEVASDITAAAAASAAAVLDILPPDLFGDPLASRNVAPFGGIAATAASGPQVGPGPGPGAITPALADLIGRYSYCEGMEDPTVAELQDLDLGSPVSLAGLWPEMALLNHSCCPNCSLLVVGGAMYVRAGRPLLEGEELTVPYLSKGLFLDVAERRALLRRSHGFVCCCPRCIMEQEHFPTRRYPELEKQQQQQQQQQQQRDRGQEQQQQQEGERQGQSPEAFEFNSNSNTSGGGGGREVIDDAFLASTSLLGRRGAGPMQALLNWMFGRGRFRTNVAPDHRLLRTVNEELVTELGPAAQAALTAPSRPRQQQTELLTRLEGIMAKVDVACAFVELPPRGRLMALASVYGLVRLTCDLAELSQQAAPERRLELLRLAAEVMEAVAPGSDAHVAAAVKAAGVARRVYGANGVSTRRAELAAASAHVARYGRELLRQPGLLREMAAVRRRLATGSGLAASMGVLAWAEQVGAAE